MQVENITNFSEFILLGLTNHREMQIFLFALILVIYLLTVLGNLMIIILVLVDTRLHTPMYYFLTHLSSLEICYITSTLPQMLVHLLAGSGTISATHCMVQMYIALSLGCTECILLSVMAYDRYLAICRPLVYTVVMNRWRQIQLASASWMGGFSIAIINVVCVLCLPFCGSNRINNFFCEISTLLKHTCANARFTEPIILVTTILVLVGPLSVILASYGFILHSVLQMRSTAGWKKAFFTCSSHLMAVTLFYGAAITSHMGSQSSMDSGRDKNIAVFYIVVTPFLNPIIYSLRNKDVHGAMAKVMQKQRVELKI